ncbi:MAG: hypothetical protein A3F67_00015 [Verrucomicrobia bacterium RIFCSPHIGHO2_12_FULL_41_10]|nr:MAG: hypothetical protein A3F67_00015 [Verrucomicrobia bacterium RIFCSPHIGHO2_12_FULL_41_10]
MELGKYLRTGRGSENMAKRGRSTIAGNSFEALIGAMYRDSGLEATRALILGVTEGKIQQVIENPQVSEESNPKGRLLEIFQSQFNDILPRYDHFEECGPPHAKTFSCRVLAKMKELGVGEGNTKKEAEAAASRKALQWLKEKCPDCF